MSLLGISRIAFALVLALVWSTGYLVGSNGQRAQAPEAASTPEPATGVVANAVAFIPAPESAGVFDFYVGLPSNCVLIKGGSDYGVARNGVVVLPLNLAAGDYTTTSLDASPLTAIAPDPSTAEFLPTSADDVY